MTVIRFIVNSLWLFFLLLFLNLGWGAAPCEAVTAEEVKEAAEQAIEIRQQTQKEVNEWAAEEAGLNEEIEALEREIKNIAWKRRKTGIYLKGIKEKIVALNKEQSEMKQLLTELEPLLDESYIRLKEFVARDMPFSNSERTAHLESVGRTLDDCDADLVQKTRRLLDVVRMETEFGLSVEAGEAELMIDGKLTRVQNLRVGRIGLFALSLDGLKVWRWDRTTRNYVPVQGFTRQVKQAVDMADRQRVIGLVELPIGRLGTAGSDQ